MTNPAYDNIAQMIDYMVAHPEGGSDLEDLARKAGYEPTYFQKLFHAYVGVTPKQLNRFMSLSRAREFLLEGYTTLGAAYEAGLSGNGRLHDLCVTIDAASPAEIKSRGKGLVIYYGWHLTPIGDVLIAETGRGICWMSFSMQQEHAGAYNAFIKRWPMAEIIEDTQRTALSAARIIEVWQGRAETGKLKLNLFGTNFQMQVWQALLKIPTGGTVSYQAIANYIGQPKANRAVGTAVGANPISLLIPCHRVIQSSGIVENYAWGSARKKMLLGLEGFTGQERPALNKDRLAV